MTSTLGNGATSDDTTAGNKNNTESVLATLTRLLNENDDKADVKAEANDSTAPQPASPIIPPVNLFEQLLRQLRAFLDELREKGVSQKRLARLACFREQAESLLPESKEAADLISSWLNDRLRSMQMAVLHDKTLVDLSVLLVIAADYPQIFMSAGEIGQELAEKLSDPTTERTGLFSSSSAILSDIATKKALQRLEKTAQDQQFKPVFSLEKIEEQAIGYLQAAAQQTQAINVKSEAVKMLADWYKKKTNYIEAMGWYLQAKKLDISVQSELAELQPKLQSLARNMVLEAIDNQIARTRTARKLAKIRTNLEQAQQEYPSPSFLVRLARCWLQQDQIAEARRIAQQVIDTTWLPSTRWGMSQADEQPKPADSMVDQFATFSAEELYEVYQDMMSDTLPPKRARPAPASFIDSYKRYQIAPDAVLLQAYLCLLDCAQHSGDPDEVVLIMQQLLQKMAQLGALVNPGLRLLEQDLYSWQANMLRQSAQRAVADQQWDTAYQHWVRIGWLPANVLVPGDRAWTAVSAWKMGASFDQVLSFLREVDAADLFNLPDRLGLQLLSAVAEHSFAYDIRDIRRFIDAATHLLPGEQAWIAAYFATQKQLTADTLKTVQAEIQAHKYVSARQRLEQVLKVDPLNAEANLWLARLYNQTDELSRARLILNWLVKESAVRIEAIAELAQIEITVGNIKEARGLLRTLATLLPDEGNTPFDDLFDALENQLENKPFILTELVHQPSIGTDSEMTLSDSASTVIWSAIFGIRLVSVWSDLPERVDLEPIKRMLLAVGQAHEQLEAITFTWRFIGQETELAIVLLCRCNGISKQQAASRAAQVWSIIKESLPYSDELYEFDPIWTRPALEAMLKPFPLTAAFEIARREQSDQLRRTSNNASSMVSVAPLETNFGLETTIASLIRPGNPPALFDIHFTPTQLTDQERAKLENAVINAREPADHDSTTTGQASGELEDAIGLNHAARIFMKMLEQPKATRFLVHIFTGLGAKDAADRSNLLALPILVGTELFGSSAYQIFEAIGRDAMIVASHNLEHVDALDWTRTWSVAGFRRLRFLFSLEESMRLIRPPLPRQGGIPGLRRLNVRSQTLPPLLSSQGIIVGESLARTNGRRKLIRIADKDRLRHLYIVGRTGTGKSSLLQNLALQDIEAGKGVAVIDPHSELVDRILDRIPPHRMKDVVFFDPSDFEYPISYNILDVETRLQANAVIADIIATFVAMYDPNNRGIAGAEFEQVVRNSMLALFEGFEGATLNDVVRFVMSKKFRDIVLKSVNEPSVREYWKLTSPNIGNWGEGSGDMIDWIVAKFGFLINDMVLRPIIGQSTNRLNMRAIMDEQKILLVDLAKGKIGGQVSQFLGLLVVSGLFNSAISRADMAPDKRQPFYVYIDEFQNITTPRITEMFSEARKFGISLTVANQHFAQLTGPVRESIIGNVGTWLSFQVGVEDSEYLSKELYPTTPKELIALPSYHLIAKILTDGVASPPFPVRTLPDSRVANVLTANQIRESTRARYGNHILFVDDDLRKKQDSTAQ